MTSNLMVAALAVGLFVGAAGAATVRIPDGGTVAFLGDSITEMGGWGAGFIPMTMKALEIAGAKNLKALKCGQSGNTSREMKARLPWVLKRKPDLLFISCGVNDAWHVARGCKLEDFKANMSEMYDLAAASNVTVVVMTPSMLKEVEDNDLNARIKPYVEWLRAEAARRGLVVADVNAFEHEELKRLEREGKRRKTNNFSADDGIHMMFPGNMMIATCLMRTLGVDRSLEPQIFASWRKLPQAHSIRLLVSDEELERVRRKAFEDEVYDVEKYIHKALFETDRVSWSKKPTPLPPTLPKDENERLFPFAFSPDAPTGVADLSALVEAPAGKHGFVRARNGRFETDAGPIRFNGVNLTGAANFPSHALADRFAARFAALGVNCVRLHFMDGIYGNWKLKPERPLVTTPSETEFVIDPERREKLDYLVAALKKRGVYVNLNLRVGRDERKKGASYFDEGLIRTQKDYARALLTHVNPYTKIAFADDPALALVEVTNEDSPIDKLVRPLGWALPEYTRFILGVERRYNETMAKFLKEELKVKCPVTGTQISYDFVYTMDAYDYLDDHAYWHHPMPLPNKGWKFWTQDSEAMVTQPWTNALSRLAARRPEGNARPYTVSEYNHPYPNPYGAEGVVLSHAFAAREDWNGLFMYSWENREDRIPTMVDYFFTFAGRSDCVAHFPAAAALFLRGDLPAARADLGPLPKETDWAEFCYTNATRMAFGVTRPIPRYAFAAAPFDWRDDRAIVSTPTAKVFTGFIRGRSFELGDGVKLSFGETILDWATVSLVKNGSSWLVAATGRARNSGKVRPHGTDWGSGPYLVEGVPATVTVPGAQAAWALDGAGGRTQPVALKDGALVAGPAYKTLWYEISLVK